MSAKGLRFTAVTVLVFALALALPCRDAFAQHRGGGGYGWGGGGRHYYSGGSWYRHGWLGFDIAVSTQVLKVKSLIEKIREQAQNIE